MTIMMMVEVTFYQVAGVIAVRNSFVSASSAMLVSGIVSCAAVTSAATIDGVLIYVIIMLMMKMSIVQIIYVIAMLDGCVAAAIGMLVVVLTMCLTVTHYSLHKLRLQIW
ncbi:MAG: hypothetical protein SGJ27_08860 [Candidatus Melainabacteria bacterium]|nr:hypothetical protein [Candidatus Melainabacteria bacterium]